VCKNEEQRGVYYREHKKELNNVGIYKKNLILKVKTDDLCPNYKSSSHDILIGFCGLLGTALILILYVILGGNQDFILHLILGCLAIFVFIGLKIPPK